MSDFKTYVSSLIFDPHHASVLLVKKKRPSWLAGKWTAVGGEQEDNESPRAAAYRELEEETGFKVEGLIPFAYVRRHESICTMLAGEMNWPGPPQQKTDEQVKIWELEHIRYGNFTRFSDDLLWLIEIALATLRGMRNAQNPDFLDITIDNLRPLNLR